MRLVPECVLYLALKTSTPHRQLANRILAMPPREASVPARGRGRPIVLPRNDISPGSSNSSAALLSGMQSFSPQTGISLTNADPHTPSNASDQEF